MLLAWPAPAPASDTQFSAMMDDNLLVYYTSDRQRDLALDTMKALGVDVVRVSVWWNFVATNAGRDKTQPKRLMGKRASNPRNYDSQIWDRYDRLVRAARDRGIAVWFNLTGGGPPWAHRRAPDPDSQVSYKPSVRQWEGFVRAVSGRYSGGYRDENEAHEILPKVSVWSIWNEPNQPLTLTPQSEKVPGVGTIPVAPIIYRELYYAARQALDATGHVSDQVWLGELAPLGKDTRGVRSQLRPKLFLREMLCLKGDLTPYTGAAAKARRCDELKVNGPLRTTGVVVHPYTQKNPPYVRDRSRDSVNMASAGDLGAYLDRLSASSFGVFPGNLPVVLGELGWQTNPPDPFYGIDPLQQAAFMNIADHIAYRAPRIIGQTQFLLQDAPPNNKYRKTSRLHWYSWQSGLLLGSGGKPKPSFNAYTLPFDVSVGGPSANGGRDLNFWGQVRFVPNGEPTTIALDFKAAGSSTWTQLSDQVPVANVLNFFDFNAPWSTPGSFRIRFTRGGFTIVSRAVPINL